MYTKEEYKESLVIVLSMAGKWYDSDEAAEITGSEHTKAMEIAQNLINNIDLLNI